MGDTGAEAPARDWRLSGGTVLLEIGARDYKANHGANNCRYDEQIIGERYKVPAELLAPREGFRTAEDVQ